MLTCVSVQCRQAPIAIRQTGQEELRAVIGTAGERRWSGVNNGSPVGMWFFGFVCLLVLAGFVVTGLVVAGLVCAGRTFGVLAIGYCLLSLVSSCLGSIVLLMLVSFWFSVWSAWGSGWDCLGLLELIMNGDPFLSSLAYPMFCYCSLHYSTPYLP